MDSELFLQLGTAHYYPGKKGLMAANGEELKLRPQSLEVLDFLADNPNQMVPKDELFRTIWKDVNVTDDSLVQCVSEIRRLLKDCEHKILQTVPKRGYRLTTTPTKHLKFPNITDQAPVESMTPVDIPTNRPALAVMGFQNIGADHTGDVVAVGLATDIHFNLAKMSRLFVIAQASANRIQHSPPHEIGQQLGVSYLVYGTTQRSAKHVRATISLVEAESNKILWSEQYEQPLGNFFQLQDDITFDVVMQLDHFIEHHEIRKAFSAAPDNHNAWELYHQGLWYSNYTQTNQTSIEKASQLLKQSLALDSGFAPAYAALSSTYILRIFLRTEPNIDDCADKALDYAYQCLEHDGQSGWGYWALGRALYMKRQFGQALDALDLSIKYKPNFSWNQYTKSMVISNSTIRDDEALSAANQALRFSPVDPNRFAYLSAKTIALIQQEDYEEAAICGVHAANEPRAYHMTHITAALALMLSGQQVAAKKHTDRAFELMPKFCLKNYRNALPHADEEAPGRILIINTLKKLGVPETSNG